MCYDSKQPWTSNSTLMGECYETLELVHLDHAGPYLDKVFLVAADAFSKWLEVFEVPSVSSASTISRLRRAFATHGIPEIIVSDNGTAFTSSEFQDFCKKNGINHVTSAPYHPSSNGTAERTVQTFKSFMEKQDKNKEKTECLISRFLFSYRNTPHSRTGRTPSEMMMNRRPRTHLTPLKPAFDSKVKGKEVGDSAKLR